VRELLREIRKSDEYWAVHAEETTIIRETQMSRDTEHNGGVQLAAAPRSDEVSIELMPTADEVIIHLTQMWQEMLGVDSIEPDENYFDLGGDSILGVQLFMRIEREFHVKLPLATLFDTPTIRELGQLLQRETSSLGWSSLVAIQTAGTRPPFFCVHPHGGNVLVYRALSQHLGTDQPLYGLQCRGLDGTQPPLDRMEDMADLYVKEIRKKQPHGPYYLGGYCMGGAVAFEIAQRLRSRNEEVALLALFDTMNWFGVSEPSIWLKTYHFGQRLTFHAANFLTLDSKGRTAFFREKAKTVRHRIRVWRSILHAKFSKNSGRANSDSWILGQIWKANLRAYMNYAPQPYLGKVVDFRPVKQYRGWDGPELKWEQLAKGGQRVVVLPVSAPSMLTEPFVRHLAVALRESIDEAIHECSLSQQGW
jgi:phthiocerol/phenolphthiocerol synthesis type-I polyketide synthase E